MKKILTSLAIVLAVAITLCVGVFASACNNSSTANELTVTVVYPDGKAVDGTKDGNGDYNGNAIKVQFCDADNGENCYQLLNLGADGKITQSISQLQEALEGVENFSLHILGLPDGYSYDENIVLSAKNASVTIQLVKA